MNLYPNYARVVESEATVKESQLGTRTYREHIDVYCRTSPLDYVSYDFYVMFDDPQDRARRPSGLRRANLSDKFLQKCALCSLKFCKNVHHDR